MALQKQLAHINLTGSLERKDDSWLVIPSKLTRADDVVFDDASSVIVRGGQSQQVLTTDGYSSEAVGQAHRMFPWQSNALLESANGVHLVAAAGARQIRDRQSLAYPRAFPRAGMTTKRIAGVVPKASVGGAGTPYYAGNYDAATSASGITCTAFETKDSSTNINTIRILITDLDGAPLGDYQLNTLLSKARVKPRVVCTGSEFFVYFGTFTVAGNQFEIRRIGFSEAGTTTDTEAVVVTSSAAAGVIEQSNYEVLFDVGYFAATPMLGLVYRDVDAPYTLRFRELTVSDGSTILNSANVAPSAMPTSLTAHAYVSGAGVEILHALFSVGTTTARGIWWNTAGGTGAEATLGTAAAGYTVGRIAAYTNDDATLTVAFDALDATLVQSTLWLSNATQGHVLNSTCPAFESGWYIAGRIAAVRSRLYLPMAYFCTETLTEGTHYIIDLTSALRNLGSASNNTPPDVVARIDYGENGITRSNWRSESRVPSLSVAGEVLYYPYLKWETDLVLTGGVNSTSQAIAQATIDFASQLGHVEVNGLTVLAGACPRVFDGRSLVEEGFHHAPRYISAAPVAGPTAYGPFPTGSVTICFTVGWQDNQGNWHESAPSNEETLTFGPNLYLNTPTLILPPTLKTGYVVRMYRTRASSTDTTLYLTRDSAGTFTSLDTDLAASEALYTTGDILPNVPMPACRHLSLFQSRVVATGVGDGSRVVYSKQYEPGYGVEFTDDSSHRTLIPASLGRGVGSQEIDDRLFVLCENGAGMIYGQGPAATGLAGEYSLFNTVVTETGCSWDSPKSIIRAPEGVWFRSPFGLRLISRQGSLARGQDGKQVGAEVDDLVSGTCVAVAGDSKQQVRFYQSGGTVLVWDYQWGKWTRFTSHANVDAVYADDRFYHVSNVSTTPLLRYYDETAYRDVSDAGDADSTFEAYVATSWLQFAGIQGFQRIYRLMLVGRNSSSWPVYIRQRFYYDFNETEDTADQPENQFTPAGTGYVVQTQHHFLKQKCEALKILTRMRAGSGAAAGRFRLTDLTLQVGVKPGYYKLPSSQRF